MLRPRSGSEASILPGIGWHPALVDRDFTVWWAIEAELDSTATLREAQLSSFSSQTRLLRLRSDRFVQSPGLEE